MDGDAPTRAVLLDLDGTLVDSVYLHVDVWQQVLRDAGYDVPGYLIHAGIGMGGKRLVPWLVGGAPDELTELAEAHDQGFLDRADRLLPTPGARALVEDLERREVAFSIATSAKAVVRDTLLDVLGRPDLSGPDADAVDSSKPAADLLLEAIGTLGAAPDHVTLIGDSPWDAEAGRLAGIRTIAVRTGGFGDDALTGAGAFRIVDTPRWLIGQL